MLQDIIAQTRARLQQVFDRQTTNQAAREAHWLMRQSKMDGLRFLQVFVLGFLRHPRASLNQLSQTGQDLGLTISPQGVDERLTSAAVTFLRERLTCLLAQLQLQPERGLEALASFSEVYFQDSTTISLPESMKSEFPGSGGSASPAALKVQLLFGFLSGQMAHLSVETGRAADQSYLGHLAHLLPGSLLIQDLGFFNFALLQGVMDRLAFFLTRWRTDVQVYGVADPTHRVEMPALLRQQEAAVARYAVTIGRQARLEVGMICVRLPQAIAAERRRRVTADTRRRGRTVSERTLFWCDWNIFVTNVPEDQLSLKQVLVCYSFRWQVELLFKLWKSQAALQQLGGLRRERVLCEFYAKLIGLVLTQLLIAPLRFLFWEQQIEISLPKARQILEDRLLLVLQALTLDPLSLAAELQALAEAMLRFARKTKRKTHPSTLIRLRLADQLELAELFSLA